MATTTQVLVVDDNDDCLKLVRSMLRGQGIEVLTANSGAAALDLLAENTPDIVLLDVMMPGMNGFEVLEAIRQSAKHYALPVIMLTASTNDDDVMSAYQFGSDYYITKPFTSQQLRYGIELVLGRETTAVSEEA
jgi:DNA-binding response OmpR family regulator